MCSSVFLSAYTTVGCQPAAINNEKLLSDGLGAQCEPTDRFRDFVRRHQLFQRSRLRDTLLKRALSRYRDHSKSRPFLAFSAGAPICQISSAWYKTTKRIATPIRVLSMESLLRFFDEIDRSRAGRRDLPAGL